MHSEPPEKKLDCRQEAQAIRAMAMGLKNATVREQLFIIAGLYEKLADLSDHVAFPAEVDWTAGRTDAV
jgi:hypothetical protein